jgi:hypothetical protein
MLFQVEALLQSLKEAGTAVDLATQAAFENLRTRTLKQQQEAFAAQAGKGSAQKKIAWQDVSTCPVLPLHCLSLSLSCHFATALVCLPARRVYATLYADATTTIDYDMIWSVAKPPCHAVDLHRLTQQAAVLVLPPSHWLRSPAAAPTIYSQRPH